MVINKMRELLQRISNLCYQASEKIFENGDTKEILDTCDKLQDMIDNFLEND